MRAFICLMLLFASNQSFAQTATDIHLLAPPLPSPYYPTVGQTLSANQPFLFGGPMPAGSQFIDLLGSEHYRKHIDFSKEQVKQYNQLQKEYGEATDEVFAKFPELKRKDLPWKERKVLNQKAMLEHKKLKEEFSERAKETLVPHQLSLIKSMRFRQFAKSFGFGHAVSNPPFSEELKTTDAQKKKIAKINSESQVAMQKKMAEMKAEAKSKIMKVLDAKQRRLLKEIEGEK